MHVFAEALAPYLKLTLSTDEQHVTVDSKELLLSVRSFVKHKLSLSMSEFSLCKGVSRELYLLDKLQTWFGGN